jgi:hypothetical protein
MEKGMSEICCPAIGQNAIGSLYLRVPQELISSGNVEGVGSEVPIRFLTPYIPYERTSWLTGVAGPDFVTNVGFLYRAIINLKDTLAEGEIILPPRETGTGWHSDILTVRVNTVLLVYTVIGVMPSYCDDRSETTEVVNSYYTTLALSTWG